MAVMKETGEGKVVSLPSNSFLTVLQRKEVQESLLTEASIALGALALAVKVTKKKGTLSLVLTVEPQKGGAISIAAAINSKAPPTAEQHLTIFFVDESGSLTRNDPGQKELPLTAHDGGKSDEAEEKMESTTGEAKA